MVIMEHGEVQDGGIVLSRPLTLPNGTEIMVRIEPRAAEREDAASEEFAKLPFFGMWKDREDMSDGASWVGAERERWQRANPEP